MEFESSKRAIVQIRFANSDAIAGTGFFVSDRYLLTCAHVVREALFNPDHLIGASLSIAFFNNDAQAQPAEVIFYEFDPTHYGADAAVLYLPSASQWVAHPIPLRPLQQFNEAGLRVFGFPNDDSAGRNLTAVTRGEVSGGWVQVEDTKEPGLAIEAGFSGSPVWCEADHAAVGMIVARHQGRDEAKVGFMIPVQKLQSSLQAIKRHSLSALLQPHQAALSEQITKTYKVCRPAAWPEPFAEDLESRLADLALMSADKLVEFAACLLNQPQVDSLKVELIAWIEKYKRDETELSTLLDQMKARQGKVASQLNQAVKPCLLVSIQADKNTKKDPYQVNAWLVRNTNRYNPATREGYDSTTGEGADPLAPLDWRKYVDDPEAIDLTVGVRYEYLPVLLADYIDQAARRGISLQELTMEFFLPMPLINQAIEQCCIPVEFGFPEPLGVDQDCAHVVIRSQERLAFVRGLKLWEKKWNRLQNEPQTAAKDAFVDGDQLSPKQLQAVLMSALGLKLTKKLPKAANQGEIGVLLATGVPAAVWIRCRNISNLAERLDTEILNRPRAQVPENIHALRRNTSALDEDADPDTPPELGHHLSFLWEDFYRVPPRITYSDAKL